MGEEAERRGGGQEPYSAGVSSCRPGDPHLVLSFSTQVVGGIKETVQY